MRSVLASRCEISTSGDDPHHAVRTVVLGHPEPVVAPRFRLAGELDGALERLRRGLGIVQRAQVEDAQSQGHGRSLGAGRQMAGGATTTRS